MKKTLIVATSSLGVLSLMLFVNVGTADAFWVAPPKPPRPIVVVPPRPPKPVAHPYIIRQHEWQEAKWENCNYDAWKATVGNSPITEQINRDNFGEFCQMHLLANDAKYGQANAVRKDLELPVPPKAYHPFWPMWSWHR